MSVIAFKDGKMAGDTRSFTGSIYFDGAIKVYSIPSPSGKVLVGLTGEQIYSDRVLVWLKAKYKSPNITPDKYPDPDNKASALVWDGSVLQEYAGSEYHCVISDTECYTIGQESCANIALGAMLAGKSAEHAVIIASSCCAWCGGGVDVIER